MTADWRVRLARELTARARMPPSEALKFKVGERKRSHRLGITGPPGAGKSTLIGQLAKYWLAAGSKVGILAIDPTSPFSGGSLLGDRVRMDDISGSDQAFVRSAPSRSSLDGLCPNVLPMLDAFDEAAFDRVVLETVGVGQVSYQARDLVDTFALILVPESGDTVQAMKAGIIETADICVVNKADRPGSDKLISELSLIAKWRAKKSGWRPPVLAVSSLENTGIAELAAAIERHRSWSNSPERGRDLQLRRERFHLKSSLMSRLDEILDSIADQGGSDSARLYQDVLSQLKAM